MAQGLRWWNVYLILAHTQDAISFGQNDELEELLSLGSITLIQCRAVYEAGYTTLQHLAYANPYHIMKALHNSVDWSKAASSDFLPPSLMDVYKIQAAAKEQYIQRLRRLKRKAKLQGSAVVQ